MLIDDGVRRGTCEPPGLIAERLSIVSMISTIDITAMVLIAPARQNAGSSKYMPFPFGEAVPTLRFYQIGVAKPFAVIEDRDDLGSDPDQKDAFLAG